MAATLREARERYFRDNGFPEDGGYSDTWVKVALGPIPFYFPNSDARRRAVRYHDLNHVVTGYQTDLTGEAEIGAWEVASSCRGYGAALFLDLQVMGFVLPAKLGCVYRAFVRGRHTENLYGRTFDDALLDRNVDEVRTELGLDRDVPPATSGDRLAFAGWAATSLAMVWGPGVAFAAWLGWVYLA